MRRRQFVAAGLLASFGESLLAGLSSGQTTEGAGPAPQIEIPGFGKITLDPAAYDASGIAARFRQNFPQGVALLREHYGEAIRALNSQDTKQMARLAGPLVKHVGRVASLPLVGDGVKDALMTDTPADGVQLGPNPVYYVNGIFTQQATARDEARELAKQLPGRGVSLFYNAGTSPSVDRELAGKDIEEAYRDRVWPVHLTGLLTGRSLGAGLQSVLGGDSPLQHNPTTRALAHTLWRHATDRPDEPVAVVGYSQGAMIVRNALFTLALLGEQEFVEKRVAFVAPGLPINNHEVWPVPKKFTPIIDPRDPVPAYFGLQGDGLRPADAAVKHHGWFNDGYASRIKPAMLEA